MIDRSHIVLQLKEWGSAGQVLADCGVFEYDDEIPDAPIRLIRAVTPEGRDPDEILKALSNHPLVAFAEFDAYLTKRAEWGTAVGPYRVAVGGVNGQIPAGVVAGDILLQNTVAAAGWTAKTPEWAWQRVTESAPAVGSSFAKVIAVRGCASDGDPFSAVSSKVNVNGFYTGVYDTNPLSPEHDGALLILGIAVGGDDWGVFVDSVTPPQTEVGGYYFQNQASKATVYSSVSVSVEDGAEASLTLQMVALRPVGAGTTRRYYGQVSDPSGFDRARIRIDLPRARKRGRGNAAIKVCVIDDGVLPHEDLPTFAPGNEWNECDGTPTAALVANPQTFGYGHGNGTGGIIWAKDNNGLGVTGIAPGCTPSFIAVEATNSVMGPPQFKVVAAITRASKPVSEGGFGAKVLNLSLGGPGSAAYNVVTAAARTYGSSVVAAAGNQTDNLDFVDDGPSESTGVICVGATESDTDAPKLYSNYGTPVDIACPADMLVPRISYSAYSIIGGTSSSCPGVAGVLAGYIYSVNPNLTPDEAEAILFATVDFPSNPDFRAKFSNPNTGVVNAAKAQAASLATLPDSDPQLYARFMADSSTPFSVTTDSGGTVATVLSDACAIELIGFCHNKKAPASPLPVSMVELWLGDTLAFAGSPQTIKVSASNSGTQQPLKVVVRGPDGKYAEETFDDVFVSALTVTQANTAPTAVVTSLSDGVATLLGSRAVGATVNIPGATSYSEPTSQTWTAEVPVEYGTTAIPITASGGGSYELTVEYHPEITVTCTQGFATIVPPGVQYDPEDPTQWWVDVENLGAGENVFDLTDGVETYTQTIVGSEISVFNSVFGIRSDAKAKTVGQIQFAATLATRFDGDFRARGATTFLAGLGMGFDAIAHAKGVTAYQTKVGINFDADSNGPPNPYNYLPRNTRAGLGYVAGPWSIQFPLNITFTSLHGLTTDALVGHVGEVNLAARLGIGADAVANHVADVSFGIAAQVGPTDPKTSVDATQTFHSSYGLALNSRSAHKGSVNFAIHAVFGADAIANHSGSVSFRHSMSFGDGGVPSHVGSTEFQAKMGFTAHPFEYYRSAAVFENVFTMGFDAKHKKKGHSVVVSREPLDSISILNSDGFVLSFKVVPTE